MDNKYPTIKQDYKSMVTVGKLLLCSMARRQMDLIQENGIFSSPKHLGDKWFCCHQIQKVMKKEIFYQFITLKVRRS